MGEEKILLVDDEPAILQMFSEAFEIMGYKVFAAASGEEALKILENENIQVMFLDLNLPGMSGVELCRRIRADKPIAIIYAVTGYVSLFELTDCREAGFDDYFSKPVPLRTLVNAAQEAFKKLTRWGHHLTCR